MQFWYDAITVIPTDQSYRYNLNFDALLTKKDGNIVPKKPVCIIAQ